MNPSTKTEHWLTHRSSTRREHGQGDLMHHMDMELLEPCIIGGYNTCVWYMPLLVVGKEYPWTVRRTRARKIRVGGCNDQRLKTKEKRDAGPRLQFALTIVFPGIPDGYGRRAVEGGDEEDRRWDEDLRVKSSTYGQLLGQIALS
jgi:hypothetical protein